MPRRDPKVAAAAAAARAALGDVEDELDSDDSPMGSAAYDRVKPDLSMFALPAGDGPIQDISRLSAREVAALVPPAFAFPANDRHQPLEITNWDTSDSDADPGSPELRRSLPPAPMRKIDKMWGSSG